ncbi:hypothetical protein OAQ76_00100 [bacterium]|nr:hypothetical protein [bacterium]
MCTRVFLITGQQHACSVPIKLSSENSNLGYRLADNKIAKTRQINLMANRQIGFGRRRFGTLRYWHENCLYQEPSNIVYGKILREKRIKLFIFRMLINLNKIRLCYTSSIFRVNQVNGEK